MKDPHLSQPKSLPYETLATACAGISLALKRSDAEERLSLTPTSVAPTIGGGDDSRWEDYPTSEQPGHSLGQNQQCTMTLLVIYSPVETLTAEILRNQ